MYALFELTDEGFGLMGVWVKGERIIGWLEAGTLNEVEGTMKNLWNIVKEHSVLDCARTDNRGLFIVHYKLTTAYRLLNPIY